MKTINDISELPKWFSPTKYESGRNLDALGWYWQFQARITLSFAVTWRAPIDFLAANPGSKQAQREELANDLLTQLRESPIIDSLDPVFIAKFVESDFLPSPEPGVRLPSTRDLVDHLYAVDEISRLQILTALTNPNNGPLKDELRPHKYAPSSQPNQTLFRINLDLPDSVLIKSFTTLLAEFRSNDTNGLNSTRYREPDYSDWIRIGILPYLDLSIWAAEHDIDIPRRIRAQAIFPDSENEITSKGEDTLRKTTEKLAHRLFYDDHLLEILSSR